MDFELSSQKVPDGGSNDDPLRNVVFGNESVIIPKCPYCQRLNVATETTQEASYLSIIVLFLWLIIFRGLAFLFIPLISHFLSEVHHTCSKCDSKVGVSANNFSCMPKIENEVVTLRMGSCATVMSKKYLYCISLLLGTVGGIYGIHKVLDKTGIPNIPAGLPSGRTWEQYAKDCSFKSNLGHPLKAHDDFARKYSNHTVTWEGTLTEVKEGFWGKNLAKITMPNTPQTHPTTQIVGIFDRELNDIIKGISLGEAVSFTATPMEMSTRNEPAVFFLHTINEINKIDS